MAKNESKQGASAAKPGPSPTEDHGKLTLDGENMGAPMFTRFATEKGGTGYVLTALVAAVVPSGVPRRTHIHAISQMSAGQAANVMATCEEPQEVVRRLTLNRMGLVAVGLLRPDDGMWWRQLVDEAVQGKLMEYATAHFPKWIQEAVDAYLARLETMEEEPVAAGK